MKNGPARFAFYLGQLEKLFGVAAEQSDPALWLYQNNARTLIFMIEGLAKLYGGLHNGKTFGKIGSHFKLLEDSLGAIDYYDAFAKEFAQDKTVSADITALVSSRSLERAAALNEILVKNGWIGKSADRMTKIRKRLEGADWMKEKDEVKAIRDLYRASIAKIDVFAREHRKGFTELESQVHELRRKLRWLSIYPQALRGCIQLTDSSSNDADIRKYLVPEIVNSPFNKLPAAGDARRLLMFNRDYFFALSWMIAELGKLKDRGLRIVVMNEFGVKSPDDKKVDAAILKQASDICRPYFDGKYLDKLINGIAKS